MFFFYSRLNFYFNNGSSDTWVLLTGDKSSDKLPLGVWLSVNFRLLALLGPSSGVLIVSFQFPTRSNT